MAKHLTIIGIGRLGLSLIDVLPADWTLTVVDIREDALADVPEQRGGQPVERVVGDATSRLVLGRLGLTASTEVAVTTGSDEVNMEIARLLREAAEVSRIVCVLNERASYDASVLQDIDVIERSQALANLIFNRLGWTEVHAVGLGLGQGELLETRILDGSPAVGQPLKQLHPQQWLVAAVYRKGTLVIPHGETVLEVDDRVLLVGEPSVLQSVGAFVRGGEPVFPLQFGPNFGIGPGATARSEAIWYCEHTLAEDLIELDPELLEPGRGSDGTATAVRLHELGVGCLVIEPQPIRWTARVGLSQSRRKRLVAEADVPVLVARGNVPVRRVLLAVSQDEQIQSMANIAIDIARLCKATLTVLTVLPPSLSEGEEQLEPLRKMPRKVAHVARLYDVTVSARHAVGNPIALIRQHAADFDLLVLGNAPGHRNSLLTPDVSLFLLHDAPCSTLFVPWDVAHR